MKIVGITETAKTTIYRCTRISLSYTLYEVKQREDKRRIANLSVVTYKREELERVKYLAKAEVQINAHTKPPDGVNIPTSKRT